MNLSAVHAPAVSVASFSAGGLQAATDPSAFRPGDEVLLINMQGGAASCASVGAHEFLRVASVQDGSVVFASAVQEIYGSGGNENLADQRVMMLRVPNFEMVTVQSGASLTVDPWNGATGGLLVMRVANELRIESGAEVTVDGKGYLGGQGYTSTSFAHGMPGESICGLPTAASYLPNDGGGGGGKYMGTSTNDGCGQGGGGGAFGLGGSFVGYASSCISSGANSPVDNGGQPYGEPSLGRWLVGSGGGAGGSDEHSNDSGSGGRGAGLIAVFARTILLDGSVSASGTTGTVPQDFQDSGSGGGGAGGAVYFRAMWLEGGGRVTASGGPGAASVDSWNSGGGHGGVGRIRIDYQLADGQPHGSALATEYLAAMAEPDPGFTASLHD